ncbi:hypothetical protein SXCC_02350 [Gluconacetobacter sp. SXCC-1]|uniref:Uncharacterized protein n=1 Tax=Komagataeibacter rhaeticus TaxID=215221 RepID=A0A181CA44_9PROT|nr:hypothetical protein [Komagataeibacter rhaeticus]ATU73044.1 hypothetical protein CT154_09550 [Komagataeibacter xylinus]EGG77138.1 hypothetical protein SXCC_02350 [Gluconacetobacter sp. SXCC-1]QIP35212.1 hypothetical protein GWK63_06805 [Komagataeibacter rhaeticus]QOC47775.1 hypothetical protein ICJ78_06860 [Komagataeibacter rhaeticus]WPP22860.1 hypothetical protein SCD25_05070 [Komagataeibacter rhaeticus]
MRHTVKITTILATVLSLAGCYGPRHHHDRGWHDGYYGDGYDRRGGRPYRGGPMGGGGGRW